MVREYAAKMSAIESGNRLEAAQTVELGNATRNKRSASPFEASFFVPIGMNWNENADCVSRKLLKEWWPETGSNSALALKTNNLLILKHSQNGKNARYAGIRDVIGTRPIERKEATLAKGRP